METKELQTKSPDELRRMAYELRARLREGRFHLAMNQPGKLKSVREARKDLARVETILQASPSETKA